MQSHKKPKARGGGKPHGLEAQQAFERQSAAALCCYSSTTLANRQGPMTSLILQAAEKLLRSGDLRHADVLASLRREMLTGEQ